MIDQIIKVIPFTAQDKLNWTIRYNFNARLDMVQDSVNSFIDFQVNKHSKLDRRKRRRKLI